jgi:hypothetical protein
MITGFLLSAREHPDLARVFKTLRERMPPYRFRKLCSDWRRFRRYCHAYDLQPLPARPETVLRYLLALRACGYRRKTIAAMFIPISRSHREAGYPSPSAHPLVSQALRAIARVEKPRPAQSMPPEMFRRVLDRIREADAYSENWRIRTAAMVALGYWGMLNPLEVGSLTMEQLTQRPDRWIFRKVGYRNREVILDRGTDPSYCAIALLEQYIAAANVSSGALWRRLGSMSGTFSAVASSPGNVAPTFGFFLKNADGLAIYSFNSLRNGALEAAFHAGAPYYELVRRSGFRNQQFLIARLHQIVTLRPGDRVLPPLGKRAPALIAGRGRKRPRARYDI